MSQLRNYNYFLKIYKIHLEYHKGRVLYLLVVGLVYLHSYLIYHHYHYCCYCNSLLQTVQRIKDEIDIVLQSHYF